MTSHGGTRPKPLTEKGIRKLIETALQRGTYIEEFSLHVRFDHPERHLSIDDLLHGLRQKWRGCKTDDFDPDEWQWKYRVKTYDIEGFELIVVVALDTKNIRFTIVTAFYDE